MWIMRSLNRTALCYLFIRSKQDFFFANSRTHSLSTTYMYIRKQATTVIISHRHLTFWTVTNYENCYSLMMDGKKQVAVMNQLSIHNWWLVWWQCTSLGSGSWEGVRQQCLIRSSRIAWLSRNVLCSSGDCQWFIVTASCNTNAGKAIL